MDAPIASEMAEAFSKGYEKQAKKEEEKVKDIVKGIDPDALEALCARYDNKTGSYPEHEWEGDAIFEFFEGLKKDTEKGRKRRKKDERKADLGLKQLGVTLRIYHIRQYIWPFAGVTIVTADREGSFSAVKSMVQKEISMHTLNKATKTKKDLNDLGIFGVAICDARDQYNKKRGRTIAKGRLLKHLKQERVK
jgi:hypothetical protein